MGVSSRIPDALLADPSRLLNEWIVPRLRSAIATAPELRGIEAWIEIELRGDKTWCLALENGALAIAEGAAKQPTIILELDASDLSEMVLGALRPSAALVDGRLSLAGDVALAMRLAPLLNAVSIEIM